MQTHSLPYRLICRLTLAVFATQSTLATAALTLAEQPLQVAADLPPNLVLTLDDSGSMQFGYSPDSVCGPTPSSTSMTQMNSRRYKSSAFNAQYYDPTVTYTPPPKADGTQYPNASFTAAQFNGFNSSSGTVNLSNNYRVTSTLDPSATTATGSAFHSACNNTGVRYARHPAADFANPDGVTGAYYYVYRPNAGLAGCSNVVSDEDCYQKITVSATSGTTYNSNKIPDTANAAFVDERQNFANWYSYYRTRNLAVVSGTMRAFSTLDPKTRVAWQALHECSSFSSNGCSGWGSPASSLDNRIRTFNSAHKERLYTWLSRLTASGGTPLRSALVRVGEYYKTSGVNSPYADDPQVTAGTQWGCRQNYALLMTDGTWNTDNPSVTTRDEINITTMPDGVNSYTQQAPYKGSTTNTLADIAFHYWANDLSSLSNNVTPFIVEKSSNATTQFWNAKNDPATWQHMTTFTVGLGLTKGLADGSPSLTWDKSVGTYGGSYSDLVAGTTAWPAPASDSLNNVSDLWHAAINSRGQFFAADSPTDLISAFQKIIDRVEEKSGTASSIAANATQFAGAKTRLYIPSYTPNTWTGDLRRVAVDANGNLPAKDSEGLYTYEWSAAKKLTSATGRKIITSIGGVGKDFTVDELGAPAFLKQSGDSDALAQARLNWIRGDASNEGTGLNFRKREDTKLGDIINSSVVRVGTPGGATGDSDYLKFISENCAPSPDGTYQAGCSTSQNRPAILLVGANDGMLHAFKDTDGTEAFAYIPEAVHSRLINLPNAGYTHKFYVDGTPRVADAKLTIGTTKVWKTVAVGGLNAGGRGVYALDITNPASFTKSNVIWEFNSSSSDVDAKDNTAVASDMGYSYGRPVIVKMSNNRYAAVFGNGYNSGSDKAFLYIKFLDGSKEVRRLATDSATSNGLSSPSVVDTDNNGTADYVYAGDLQGRIWKFDVKDQDFKNWGAGKKLFEAQSANGTTQPITSAPSVIYHPYGGLLVLFGSGQLLQSSDTSTPKDASGNPILQTMYAVWDRQGVNGSTFTSTALKRANLEVRTFGETTIDGKKYRTLSGSPISWSTGTGGDLGWYIDLPGGGERIINPPQTFGTAAIFASYMPPEDSCDKTGSSWVMLFNAVTGEVIKYAFDTNGDGVINSNDSPLAAGLQSNGGGGVTVLFDNEKAKIYQGGAGDPFNAKPGLNRAGRLNWRDIVK